ncbi:MAG: hypothetical protein RLZZ214_2423, partial [Verrucomicrobiota bacterium]
MKRLSFIRTLLLIPLFLPLVTMISAKPLDAFRWKNRLIVVSLPDGESRKQAAEQFAARRAGLRERGVEIVDASIKSAGIPAELRLDPEQTAALRSQLKLEGDAARPVFVLIGKDGGEKDRQTGTLDLAKWFALIDGMPM